ncbi:MAG: GGDEF domain-containing protein [Planctomycetes bacterium]|nr:GGDEF domain-containing protein [Planctomycetota bacterium]
MSPLRELLERLKRTARLPSPPGAALKILDLARQEDVSLAEVADTLASDPALSVRLLKYANSPLVGASRSVTSVREAVILLGMRSVRMMALSFSLVSVEDERACPGFDFAQFWSYSLAHAVAARRLAKQNKKVAPEEAFAAGLLATIGKLAFALAAPAEYGPVLTTGGGTLGDTTRLEREAFGADYRALGGALLKDWGIPSRLSAAVEFQSDPTSPGLASEVRPLAATVHEARAYADAVRSAEPDEKPEGAGRGDAPARQRGASDAGRPALMEDMRREYQGLADILELRCVAVVDIDRIQAEAGEALSELSLAAQLRSDAVERENRGLQEKAWTDGLTGIANRGAFDQRIEEVWRESTRTGRPIGLALLDIDFFKKFNDCHGHLTGDAVLKAVAQCIPQCLREVDFVARYGGEEFAVILPNADRLVAAGICVAIRRSIEKRRVLFDDKTHRVTVSIGAVILAEPTPSYSTQMLIEAADQQLYRSKEKGRNCCSMRQLPRTPALAAVLAGE